MKAILDSCDGMIVLGMYSMLTTCSHFDLIEPEIIQVLCLIGTGAFGQVHKAVWRGTVVAAKVVHTAGPGNEKVVENELRVYQ